MRRLRTAVAVLLAILMMPPSAAPVFAQQASPASPRADLLDYLRQHRTTSFIVVQDGRVLIDETWAPPANDPVFSSFLYGRTAGGALLEDVASQQKSFVAVLAAVAIDKGLLDPGKPVSVYLGTGWSKAAPDQEARIRVIDLLTMTSGLDERFRYAAPAGTRFFYNTPVYAITKRVLVLAANEPLEAITRDWLTLPAGMKDTEWRKRPAALAAVGNDTALVTTPQDVARFGAMVLRGGIGENGRRVVSTAQLKALFTRTPANPAYGRLWWLNGGSFAIRASGVRADGPLVPAAPADLVGALGALDRRLYVVPSHRLVVVRTGAATNQSDFDQQLWLRLNQVIR